MAGRTRFQRIVDRFQNHRWVAPLLVAGLALILLANVTDAGSRIGAYFRPDAQLELVAAEELRPRILDVTVRNLSSDEAVITSIQAKVDSVFGRCLAESLLPSANFVVPLEYATGATGHLSVRQAVPPHGADRFTIALGTDAVCMTTTFRLRYNRSCQLTFSHTYH